MLKKSSHHAEQIFSSSYKKSVINPAREQGTPVAAIPVQPSELTFQN